MRTKHHPVRICRHCVKIVVQKAWRDGKKGKEKAKLPASREQMQSDRTCLARGLMDALTDASPVRFDRPGSAEPLAASTKPAIPGSVYAGVAAAPARAVVLRVVCHEYSDVTRVLEGLEGMSVGIGLEGSR
jgi:hypothetical protein